MRFKKYDNINRVSGAEREKYAEQLRQMYEYSLTVLHYNPFQEQLQALSEIQEQTTVIESKIEELSQLSDEQQRKLVSVSKALDLFIESREERIKNGNSISTYKGTVKWLKSYFESINSLDKPIGKVTRLQIANAIKAAKYRDYPIEFETVLDEMKLDQYPANYFVFGRNGEPSDKNCHKDFLAVRFKPIKEKLKLSDDYTLYGWKHTRVVHEMMKGADPYKIQHMCRHADLQTTMEYMRDFDISLVNVYGDEDLKF